MKLYEEAIQYVQESQEELIQLIKDLCAIPSFSHKEKQKALFIKEWFKALNVEVIIDEKQNAILPYQAKGDNLTVFMAHIDTVFPDEIGFDCIEKDGYLHAPGVGDDTTNVAELMLIAKYIIKHALPCENGCLFVFNSCEEGLGNLEGSKYLLNTYEGRIKEFYSFDGSYKHIVCKAVGSLRYKVKVYTEGGHSYGAFGNRNAIALASKLISTLYEYNVPKRGKSTYNVGFIEGGTSVNTIAQKVEFLFEYRSDHREDLAEMKHFFFTTINNFKKEVSDIEVELLGERPCMGDVDKEKMDTIIENVNEIISYFAKEKATLTSGSTDCNTSFSKGICGCCFGGYLGEGAHTREEKVEISSLPIGMNIVMQYVLNYFK